MQVSTRGMYPIRQATGHPVHENWRVSTFGQLLQRPSSDTNQMAMLGEIMMQVCHIRASSRLLLLLQHDISMAASVFFGFFRATAQ